MSRRVPEAAVLVGVVLSLSFAAYGVLFGDPLSTVLVSTLLLYLFVGYAVVVDDDPAATLKPDPVLAVASVAGGLVFAAALAVGRPFVGLVTALVLVVPPALFHASHARSVNPLSPDRTLFAAAAAALFVLLAGVVGWRLGLVSDSASQLAGLAAALIALGAGEYHTRRAGRLSHRVERAAVGTAFVIGLLALGYFPLVGAARTGLAVGMAALVVGAYFALVGDDRGRRRRA